MAGIDFTEIEGCQGNNDEVLYSSTTNISTALWDTSGFISMGIRPNGDNTPSNWTPTDTSLKNSVFWNGLFPWIAIYSGVDHTATNTRVEISNFECFVYSKLQKAWVDLTTNDTKQPASELNMNYIMLNTSGSVNKRIEANGNVSYKLDSVRHPVKAWLAPKRIYGEDVGGIMITCQAKLILDDEFGTDDITAGTAHLLLSVGADYRPDVTTNEADFTPEKSPPALGSKFTLITGTNKTFYAVPLNPPGVINTGSVWYAAGNRPHISTEWFERNLPKSFFDRPSIFDDAEYYAPLKTSLIPTRAVSGTPTFTRATVATVFTDENKLVTVPSGCARFHGARFIRNLFTRSEAFEASGWNRLNLDTITTGHTDPFGTTKARFIQVTTSAANSINTGSIGTIDNISGDEICFSIYIKAGNWNQYVIQIQVPSKNVHQYFNLSSGTLGSVTTSGGATKLHSQLDDVGNGWYRIQLTAKFAQGDGTVTCTLRAVKTDGTISYGDPGGVAGANYYAAFAMGEKTERRAIKSASEYISVGEDASPWYGANVDGVKWSNLHHDGSKINDDLMFGYQYCASNRTNLILWNRDLTNAAWVKTNITAVLNQTGIDNLASQATKLTATAANATIFQTITASGVRSSSAYVKRITGTGRIDFTRDGGTTWTDITSLISGAEYTRVLIESSSVTNPVVGFRIVVSGNEIAVDFVQDEDGAEATNPIYTTTASAVRNADVLTYPASNHNDVEGTIFAQITRGDWTKNNGSAIGSATTGLFTAGSINGALGKDGVNTCNPNSKNYIGKMTTPVSNVTIHNGHFWAAYKGSGSSESTGVNPGAWTSIKNEIRDNPGLLGVQLRWCWADLENDAGGTYDFSSIQGRLDELAAITGKVGLLSMMFEHKGDIPAYLKTPTYDGGQYQYTAGQSGNVVVAHNLCFWNAALQERLRLLAIQLGAFLNDKVNFSSITTQESAADTPDVIAGNGTNFSAQGHFNGLVQFAGHLKENLPNKIVRASLNFSGNSMVTGFPYAASLPLSFSWPNSMASSNSNNTSDNTSLESSQGKPGCYVYSRTYKDSNGLMPEVQRPDYYYTNLTWNLNRTDGYKLDSNGNPTIAPSGGHRPTIREIRDFLISNFKVKQIYWSRAVYINTVTGNYYHQEVLDFINLPENQIPGFGLDTSIPTIYQQTIPTGSIKMALSWLENKMYLNVEGSPVGADGTYKGSFDLTTLGIGNGGSGYIRDIYVWKTIISDEEKRQITSKKGVVTFKHK